MVILKLKQFTSLAKPFEWICYGIASRMYPLQGISLYEYLESKADWRFSPNQAKCAKAKEPIFEHSKWALRLLYYRKVHVSFNTAVFLEDCFVYSRLVYLLVYSRHKQLCFPSIEKEKAKIKIKLKTQVKSKEAKPPLFPWACTMKLQQIANIAEKNVRLFEGIFKLKLTGSATIKNANPL